MIVIGEEAKKILEKRMGLPLEQVCELGITEETALVKEKTGRNLQFSKSNDSRKIGRGSPLLALNRVTTIEEINTRIEAL